MKNWMLYVMLGVIVASCSDPDRDVVSPYIKDLALNQKQFIPGGELVVSYEVADDRELNQARVRIRSDFGKNFGAWAIIRIDDIGGSVHSGQMSFTVPDTALAGLYAVNFQAADSRGNGTKDSTLYFTLVQEEGMPSVAFFETDPPLRGERLFADTNTTLTFSAVFTDNVGLEEAAVSFQGPNHRVLRNVVQSIDSMPAFGWDYQDTIHFNSFDELPTEMVVKVTNLVGHQTRKRIRIAEIE